MNINYDSEKGTIRKFELDPEIRQQILDSFENVAETPDESESFDEPKKKNKILMVVRRALICVLTFVVVLVAGAFGTVTVLNYGPSKTVRDLFVMSALETSAIKFLATWYFDGEEIKAIVASNSVTQTDEVTDTDLVEIPDDNNKDEKFDKNLIEIKNVTGGTYRGKMMIVNDPSRVFVGTSGEYGKTQKGRTAQETINFYNGVGGVNAGGFEDLNGVGNGGTPLGIVMSEGELKWGSRDYTYEIIGFDKNNKLVVGTMTGQKAIDMGIRDAVSFGPILVVNGEPSEVSGSGGGLNPRTAIGQRADGTVLILVIDGRQSNSLGASYKDLIDVMLDFGAINAANLDGGSSSHMIYNDEIITNCSSLYGARRIPTAIVVSQEKT